MTKCALYLVNSVPLPGLGSWVLVGLGPGVGAGPEGLARLLSIFRAQSPRRMRRQDPCGKRDQLWNLMKDGGRKIGASHHTARAHHGHGPPLRASLPHAPDSIWGSGNDTERKRKRKKRPMKKGRNQRTHYRLLIVAVAQRHPTVQRQKGTEKWTFWLKVDWLTFSSRNNACPPTMESRYPVDNSTFLSPSVIQ